MPSKGVCTAAVETCAWGRMTSDRVSPGINKWTTGRRVGLYGQSNRPIRNPEKGSSGSGVEKREMKRPF